MEEKFGAGVCLVPSNEMMGGTERNHERESNASFAALCVAIIWSRTLHHCRLRTLYRFAFLACLISGESLG